MERDAQSEIDNRLLPPRRAKGWKRPDGESRALKGKLSPTPVASADLD